MLSCDTVCVGKTHAVRHENLFGKNSDRPLGEAQPLVFVPGKKHAPGETVRLTHLTIPEVSETYAVLGAKPYWIWGFEMGVNAHGVVIGNEAEGSRLAESGTGGLLGMDLLRLALERGKTAAESANVITTLLERYGQNANASTLETRTYENAFLLMDRAEILLLETAGRHWVLRRVPDMQGISNCYTIHQDYDRASDGVETPAIEHGWTRSNAPFDFAKAYTLPAPRQTNAVARYRRLNMLLAQNAPHDFATVKRIFRDHFEGTLMAPRSSPADGTFYTVCMHAMAEDAFSTASSLLVTYDEALGVVGRHAFSLPCGSVYMPVYCTGYLPEALQRGGACYDEASAWWRAERLNLLLSADYERFIVPVRETFDLLEARFEQDAATNETQAALLVGADKWDEAFALLNAQMDAHAALVLETVRRLTETAETAIRADGGLSGPRKDFILAYANRVGMPLV